MSGKGKGPAIGIDLGTTYSCVGLWQHGRVEIITNDQGNRTTPSYVAFTDTHHLIGDGVKNQVVVNPINTVSVNIYGYNLETTLWQHGRVEIIANDQGNRTKPSYVAFTDTHHLIGDGAKNQVVVNPINTVSDAKRLIGRGYSDTTAQSDMKFWPFKVTPSLDDKPMIGVTYKYEKKQFSAEEISSMVLAKMREIAEDYLGTTIKNVVVTVPECVLLLAHEPPLFE